MNPELRNEIIECLAANHQRATFGAIAQLTGYHPQHLADDLEVNPTNMFVVLSENGFPPIDLYVELLNHPSLVENPEVVDDPEELQHWLQDHGLDIANDITNKRILEISNQLQATHDNESVSDVRTMNFARRVSLRSRAEPATQPVMSHSSMAIRWFTQDQSTLIRWSIENADDRFLMLFSATIFLGGELHLTWVREETSGNVYRWGEHNMEGWLCPALLKYFDVAPKEMWVQLKLVG